MPKSFTILAWQFQNLFFLAFKNVVIFLKIFLKVPLDHFCLAFFIFLFIYFNSKMVNFFSHQIFLLVQRSAGLDSFLFQKWYVLP
jgi:hypothetical protein